MAHLEMWLPFLTFAGIVLGGLSIGLARAYHRERHAVWGRRLFVATLIFLGICGLVGAMTQAAGLAPLGLAVVFLLVSMLWETPDPATQSN